MANANIKIKVQGLFDNVKYYWKEPPKGKYMSFKEIAAYSFGGIGASFIIQLGSTLIVSTTNMIVGGAIGVAPTDMYILYLISALVNIPLTGIRANMVDNTRGKGGKYRPYLLSMGIPTILIALLYVWFPYDRLGVIFSGDILGKSGGYVATCTIVLIFNLLLQFFYNFFNDAYTNLIHVLSPNTQERTDVLAIKSIVYSLAPSILNIVLPLVAKYAANNKLYDIKVYRYSYPAFALIGIVLTIVVFANTEEKIVQAKTHTIQIGFLDSLREVAKNKYFWIISLAGWLGFLESAYYNILAWSYTYGHTCDGTQMVIINTLVGNAALWGMILAPICIRKFGKKAVLIGVNALNVVFIVSMLGNMRSIWWLFACVYFNGMLLAFEQITTPAIQADIRDYQQYRTGERIDGMFATVTAIGNIVTLITSAILPATEKHYGIYEGNGYKQPFDILDVKTGEPGLLYKMMGALILMAALGAFLNMVPYFFYDFTEKKQKSVIKVLKVRSLFEDFGNGALNNHQIVETIDMVNTAKEMAVAEPKEVSKNSYKEVKDRKERKLAKRKYKEDLKFNEEIEISKFVCKELDKFNSDLYMHEIAIYKSIHLQGLDYIKEIDIEKAKLELKDAKKLSKETEEEKEFRKFEIEFIKKKISAKRAFDKYFGTINDFAEPDMKKFAALIKEEENVEKEIFDLLAEKGIEKKDGNKDAVKETNSKIKICQKHKKEILREQKVLMDEFARFSRAAKPYNDAAKILIQQENYTHFDEIAALYDDAKVKAEEEDREKEESAAKKKAEEEAELLRKKAAKHANKK